MFILQKAIDHVVICMYHLFSVLHEEEETPYISKELPKLLIYPKITYIIHVKCVTPVFFFSSFFWWSIDYFCFHSFRTKLSLTRWSADWRGATLLYEQAGGWFFSALVDLIFISYNIVANIKQYNDYWNLKRNWKKTGHDGLHVDFS